MPVTEQIMQTIEQLRKEAGIPAYRLAEKAGIAAPTYSNLLTGKTSSIQLDTLERIADALNCDVEVILRERDAK